MHGKQYGGIIVIICVCTSKYFGFTVEQWMCRACIGLCWHINEGKVLLYLSLKTQIPVGEIFGLVGYCFVGNGRDRKRCAWISTDGASIMYRVRMCCTCKRRYSWMSGHILLYSENHNSKNSASFFQSNCETSHEIRNMIELLSCVHLFSVHDFSLSCVKTWAVNKDYAFPYRSIVTVKEKGSPKRFWAVRRNIDDDNKEVNKDVLHCFKHSVL